MLGKNNRPVADLISKPDDPVSKKIGDLITKAEMHLLDACRMHEETDHGGRVCQSERVGVLGYLAYVLGVGPDDFEELADSIKCFRDGPDAVYEINPEIN